MDTLFNAYSELLTPPLLLIIALLASDLWPESWRLQPWLLQLANVIARKTNRPSRPQEQRRFAGTLALLLILLPTLIFTAILLNMIAYPHPFELALLILMLPSRALSKDNQELAIALDHEDETRAKHLLTPWTLQETASLSALGLAKASIEVQLEQKRIQTFALIFWYALGGLILAAAVWLINQLARQWDPNQPSFQDYGSRVKRISQMLMWPVDRLLTLTITLYSSSFQQLKQLAWTHSLQQLPLQALALCLNKQLGGPLCLEGQKINRQQFGPSSPPIAVDLLRTDKLLKYVSWLWLLILALASLALSLALHFLMLG